MDTKATGSPDGSPPGAGGTDEGHRGHRLGLPEQGPGSLGGTGRRLGALFVDWMLCYIIALSFLGGGDVNSPGTRYGTIGVFALANVAMVSTVGYTFGKRLLGLRVVSVTRPRLMPLAVVVRTLLLCLVVPAAIYDRDGRGFHDKAVGSAVVAA